MREATTYPLRGTPPNLGGELWRLNAGLEGQLWLRQLVFCVSRKGCAPAVITASNFWFLSPDISPLTTFPLTSGL